MRRTTLALLPVGILTTTLAGVLIWFLVVKLAEEMVLALQVVITAATLAGVVLCVATLVFGALVGWEWWQQSAQRTHQARAETRLKNLAGDEYQVRILAASKIIHTADPGQQVYIVDVLRNLTTPLHLQPGPVNGHHAPPAIEEAQRWQVHQLANGKRSAGDLPAALEPAQDQLLADGRPELLEALVQEQRLLVLGASGSGKSSLLRHIVALKLPVVSQVVLCDPHGSRPKWGAQIDAVGFGEKFEQILECFQQLEWLHKQRIQEVAAGAPERSFPVILVVIEEVQALVRYFKKQKVDVGYYISMFLTRTRKTSIDVICVTQADTVKALGLEGFGQNRDAFAGARTLGHDGKGHRVEYINEYEERFIYKAPPLWPDSQPVGVTAPQVARLAPAPTAEQYKIIDVLLADPGASNYKICDEVWGKRNKAYYDRIEEVKALFGPFK